MQLDRTVMPCRISSLVERDYVISPQYCDQYLAASRMDAVETAYRMATDLELGVGTAWSAIRMFDLFYSKTTNPDWQMHMPMIAAVCINIAGKCISYDNNPCGNPKATRYMYELICDQRVIDLDKFRVVFSLYEGIVLKTLKFEVLMPTPDEYLSECSRWYDETNAARGSPSRPEIELKVARMTSYIVAVIMYSPSSMQFTALEIAGYASYVATSPVRSAPQAYNVDPPTMRALWTMVAWSQGNKLSDILTQTVETICKNKPNTVLARMYPEEHEKWKSTCDL